MWLLPELWCTQIQFLLANHLLFSWSKYYCIAGIYCGKKNLQTWFWNNMITAIMCNFLLMHLRLLSSHTRNKSPLYIISSFCNEHFIQGWLTSHLLTLREEFNRRNWTNNIRMIAFINSVLFIFYQSRSLLIDQYSIIRKLNFDNTLNYNHTVLDSISQVTK